MLRATKQWDIRCPQVLTNMFPNRSGYYYKVDRKQARSMVQILCRAYGIDPALVSVSNTKPYGGNRGVCWYLPGRRSRIDVHGRAHLKSVWHEWYHALDHAFNHKVYDSNDRQSGPSSLAWQFADRLFEVFRNQKPNSQVTNMATKKTRSTRRASTRANKKTAAAGSTRQRREHIVVKDSTRIKFVKMRDKGGARTKLLKLVPKSGITVSKLTSAAEKAELNTKKVKSWVQKLAYYGFVAAA